MDEHFPAVSLDPAVWSPIAAGTCTASTIAPLESKLHIGIGTRGASDRLSTEEFAPFKPIRLPDCEEISLEIDWNNQRNGCYLDASIYLSPEKIDTTPENGRNWWKFSYIGVPPAEAGRAWSSLQLAGGERVLYAEGWPQQRTGRGLAKQRLSLRKRDTKFEVCENGLPLFDVPLSAIPFAQAYLYIQVASHSNYPVREILFDDVRIRERSP